MKNKIKVVHVIGQFGVGGDTTAVLNVLDFVKKNNMEFQFDFITHKGANLDRVNKIKEEGSKVFLLKGDVKKIGIIKYYNEIKNILKNNQYDVIHFHTSFQSCVGMLAAKRCKVKKIVCHSHTSTIQRKVNVVFKFFAVPFCRFLINILADEKVACSDLAKNNLYGKNKNCKIIYNGINITKLKIIDNNKIHEIKTKYNLKNKIVVGQVGRIHDMKNPLFTIELAKSMLNTNYVFILIGDGSQMSIVKEKIDKENINNVIFTGIVNDVNNYMKIFDYLLLPSKYGEGLPVVLIEEQLINDKCLCLSADNVTREANLGNVKYLSIDSTNEWKDVLIKNKKTKKITIDKQETFDINNTSIKWLNLYR